LIVGGSVALLAVLGLTLPVLAGLSVAALVTRVLPAGVLLATATWGGAYLAALATVEYLGRRTRAHLSEPDFRVRVPLVEPLVGAGGLLAGLGWVLTSGLAADGVGSAVGAVLCTTLFICASGLAAAGFARPVAARFARDRAFAKYVAGSEASLAKQNPRRARRLLERALAVAIEPERREALEERHERALFAEAEQLRARGLEEQADALVARSRAAAPAPQTTPRPDGATSARAGTTDLVSRRSTPPRVLALRSVALAREDGPAPMDAGARTARDRAASLAGRERHREALELLVEHGLPVAPELARAAAQQYVTQGTLRSAFVLYEALGEEQIPEFYKAAAVEWARAPEPTEDHRALGDRIIEVLEAIGETASAARVACQAALDEKAEPSLRSAMAKRAAVLFARLEEAPPPELLEVNRDYARAARGYEAEGRVDDARRCLGILADHLLTRGAAAQNLIPVLSKLFLLDPQLEDARLRPLVEHVLGTEAKGAQAQRILATWRSRHPEDERAAFRLFHLLVSSERPDEALAELARIAARPGSQPASLIDDHRRLVETFPEHFGARHGLAKVLVRAGRAREATEQLEVLLDWGIEPLPARKRSELRALIGSLREWGPLEREVERLDGLLAQSLGDEGGALRAFEAYVEKGGRDPGLIGQVHAALESKIVHADGRPDFEAHANLVRFLLAAGRADAARPHLDALQRSPEHAEEALVLLARADIATGHAERGLRALAGAVEGRRAADAPALFYEIARAYEAAGDTDRARRVDESLERASPGFAARYAAERPPVDQVDTAPVPRGGDDTDIASGSAFEDRTIDETALGLQEALRELKAEADVTDDEALELGEALAPRYRLARRLGSGGMGEVHLAEDLALGREVAVKVLRRTLATDLFISKFRDEARIVAQLSHPGIVGVFDIGQRGGWSYIVMEYVRGPNLATLVSASLPPPPSQVLGYVAAVADAMAHAHRRGVVHRDLKPANILVGVDGVVKVTDFGIARVLAGDEGDQTAFSAAGLQVGTVNFMAPEQLLYDRADARTDIYLLATTLFYCLSRKYPFAGESAPTKTQQDAPRLSSRVKQVSRALDDLVAAALSRRPGDRPESMEVFAAALRAAPEASGDGDSTELLAP
jgi:tetratricopeptide (TPR) repeat protein